MHHYLHIVLSMNEWKYFYSVSEPNEPETEILNDSVLDESVPQSSSSNQTLPSSSNGLEGKDTYSTLTRPRKVKDFTVLANLVELALHCVPKCEKLW